VKPKSPWYINNLARDLRKNQTPAEQTLWEALRDRRLAGYKFRRQRGIGRYITDFYCDSAKLIVELDGAVHDLSEQHEYDQLRQKELETLGYTIIRFGNERVIDSLNTVLAEITQALHRKE
jgi:very-short-patch-repair endonuclease